MTETDDWRGGGLPDCGSRKPDRELARRYAELGVNRLIIAPRARDDAEFVRAIDETGRELIGQV